MTELGLPRLMELMADLLNNRVIPFLDEQGLPLQRVLTDRVTKYCGAPERHEYELYLAVENIDHTRTKVKSPQTNGIVERFHRTVLNEFYRVGFRRKVYSGFEQLQPDLDGWLREYNELRPHQGRWCYGKTPRQTFVDSLALAYDKQTHRSLMAINGCRRQQSLPRVHIAASAAASPAVKSGSCQRAFARALLTASRSAGYPTNYNGH